MTRIIAGRARGRRLHVPRSGTRPTSDRVREALFASIESKLATEGRTWSDVAVCDMWAGSGAIALEAWSRGAGRVLAIDKAKASVDAIGSNIDALGAREVSVVRASVSHAVQSPPPGGSFDVVFADPPYDESDESIRSDLTCAFASNWFAPEGLVVVERGVRSVSPLPESIGYEEIRPYGDTALWYGRVPGASGGNEVVDGI